MKLGLIPAVVAVVIFASAAPLAAQSVRYFRQDHGRAAADAEPLPSELDDAHLAWKTPLAKGHSTPLVVDDRIFLTAQDDHDLQTLCLDRTSGKVLWTQTTRVEKLEKVHAEGCPASASVACDGRRVFAFFGSYGLVCYTVDGTPVWNRPLGPFRDEFGSSSSPILVGDKLILCEDHDIDSYLLAVRADTGETVWQTPREGFTRSYATPVVIEVDGRKQIVMAGALQLVGYDPDSGRQLWTKDGFARIVNTTPAQSDDKLFVCTWSPGGDTEARVAMESWSTAIGLWDADKDGRISKEELPAGEVRTRFYRIDLDDSQSLDEAEWGKYARLFELAQNTLVALRPAQAGQPPEQLWEYKRGLPYVASPLVYRGQVFLAKDGGVVTLLDADSGKLIKQARARGAGNYYASPVAGDGKIYTISSAGSVTVFAAGNALEILSSRDFGERTAASPVLDRGRAYIRTEKALYAFAAQPAATATPADNARRPANPEELKYWLANMTRHRFAVEEMTAATGLTAAEVSEGLKQFEIKLPSEVKRQPGDPLTVLPYPGGRHPRIGFLEGAVRPQRETKLSVFTPWDDASYVVADVPEAIWSNLGLTYLAHTHVPTIWNKANVELPPLEWTRHADGTFEIERTLPNGIRFGTRARPAADAVRMEMWLTNGTRETLSDLRVQNCVMLKGAVGFEDQTVDNKLFDAPYAACRSRDGKRWVISAWDPCHRAWSNAPCPCLHSDPKFPDCPPGDTQRLRGWLSFYEGDDIHSELARIEATGWRK